MGLGLRAQNLQMLDYSARREREGIPPNILGLLDATVEIPQLGVIRSLNVHVSGAISMYSYSQQWGLRSCS